MRVPMLLLSMCGAVLVAACPSVDDDDSSEVEEVETPAALERRAVGVLVLLDGAPVEGAVVLQGGLPEHHTTDADGRVSMEIDYSLDAEYWVVASHPEARQGAVQAPDPEEPDPDGPLTIELTRYLPDDNPAYTFRDPGEPDRRDTTGVCAHCHSTLNADWYASPHRTAASNPLVQDLYAGTSVAADSEAACADAGGRWATGILPGEGAAGQRCYVGDGALPALNDGCGDDVPCDGVAIEFGLCADCHAPGIDGALGGRDLLEAQGLAYDYGVHCDVCHRVESVVPEAPAGVAGRLRLHRPSEQGGFGMEWTPLVFGPLHDAPTAVMGSVQRDHFEDAVFCSGCHELQQEVLVPGAEVDLERWPSGRIPVHTTYSEWLEGPYGGAAPCASCHMPPDPDALNAADLELLEGVSPGFTAGWERPPGAVRRHAWFGPRQPESGHLQLAAEVAVEVEVDGEVVTAEVTVRNAGAGHALPTGEPMRALILTVAAECGDTPLPGSGGDAVQDYGGARASKAAGEDWSAWPTATAGDVIRVVRRPGGSHDYPGVGPFGDGRFDAAAKGLPIEEVVGDATVVAVDGAGIATLDRPLPQGDIAYLGDERFLAGAPGFAFARVLVGPDGRRHVPHFLAVDVASDNRLMPRAEWTSTHRFAGACAETPRVTATLRHRAVAPDVARSKGIELGDTVMVEVSR